LHVRNLKCNRAKQSNFTLENTVACNKSVNCTFANCTDILDQEYFSYATRDSIKRNYYETIEVYYHIYDAV